MAIRCYGWCVDRVQSQTGLSVYATVTTGTTDLSKRIKRQAEERCSNMVPCVEMIPITDIYITSSLHSSYITLAKNAQPVVRMYWLWFSICGLRPVEQLCHRGDASDIQHIRYVQEQNGSYEAVAKVI